MDEISQHYFAAGPLAGPAGVDLSSMTPREAADRLFNRVMTAVAADDSTEVVSFLPMAIRSLELAEPLDTLSRQIHAGQTGTLDEEQNVVNP